VAACPLAFRGDTCCDLACQIVSWHIRHPTIVSFPLFARRVCD
jgi:hypothetical protein